MTVQEEEEDGKIQTQPVTACEGGREEGTGLRQGDESEALLSFT